MADPSNGITFRTFQEAMPEYHISTALLDGLLTALPAPPPGASAAWCRRRLTLVVEEIAARVPMDAAQGHLAAQCVLAQFLAEDIAARIRTPGLTMTERRQASGTADRLMCTVTRMERALERRQARVLPFRDVGAVDGFDLDALEAVWRRGMPGLDAAGSGRPEAAGAVDAATVTPAPPAAPEPEAGLVAVAAPAGGGDAVASGDAAGGDAVARADAAGAGDPAEVGDAAGVGDIATAGDAAKVGDMATAGDAVASGHAGGVAGAAEAGTSGGRADRSRAGVTLEQGDGWSLEVWPAGAGARVVAGLAAPGAPTDAGEKPGVAMAGGGATDRPGSRGAA